MAWAHGRICLEPVESGDWSVWWPVCQCKRIVINCDSDSLSLMHSEGPEPCFWCFCHLVKSRTIVVFGVNASKRPCACWYFGGGGVGWENNVHFDFNYIVHSLALPHIRHATLLDVLLHFHTHTHVMLRCRTFSCTFYSLKDRFRGSYIHTKTVDKTSWNFGSTCMLQSGAKAWQAMSSTNSDNFVLESKKTNFFTELLVYRITISLW